MGSRWRQMLIDYGQVLGDKSSRSSNSQVFTVSSDLSEKRNEELRLRRVMEIHFRPLFQRYVYGGEKMACHDLRRILRDPEYKDRLPPDKVHELADIADFNMGRAVRYDEFVNIVLGKDYDQVSCGSQNGLASDPGSVGPMARFLSFVCRNTQQQVMVQDRVQKYRYLPPPFFMIGITIAQIIVYIVYSETDNIAQYPLAGVSVPNKVMYMPTRRREAWRFVTYCFLHQGYIDLIFNVIIQLVLGIPLEIMFDFWRMAIVYIIGVICGSLGQSITDHYVGLVGASGGSYAIMAAHCYTLVHNWKHMNDNLSESKTKRFFCSVTLRIICMLLILIPQVALAVYRRWFSEEDKVLSGIASYIGGLVSGLLLGRTFLQDYKRYPWQEDSGWLNLFTFLIFIGGCAVFNIAYNGYPAEDYS